MPVVLEFSDVVLTRGSTTILDGVTWSVDSADRWVVLGPNGAGKTTLLQLAAALQHPTRGTVHVLDAQLGKADVFEVRPRIGFASSAVAKKIPPSETVLDVVLTAAYSVTGRWNEQYEDIDVRRANRVLAEWRLDHLAERRFGDLSDGEQKRVQIARAVMTDPGAAAARRAGREPRSRRPRGAAAAARRLRERAVRAGHGDGDAPRGGDPRSGSLTRCC